MKSLIDVINTDNEPDIITEKFTKMKKKEKQIVRMVVQINYPLSFLRKQYRLYFGEKGKVTKADIASWVGNLAESDIFGIEEKED